jgi:uncharacterized Fe-S cluster-containing protein
MQLYTVWNLAIVSKGHRIHTHNDLNYKDFEKILIADIERIIANPSARTIILV